MNSGSWLVLGRKGRKLVSFPEPMCLHVVPESGSCPRDGKGTCMFFSSDLI